MIIGDNLTQYLYYELLSMYYEYIDDEEKLEFYAEKAVEIWYKLTEEEINYLNARGYISSIKDVIDETKGLLENKQVSQNQLINRNDTIIMPMYIKENNYSKGFVFPKKVVLSTSV